MKSFQSTVENFHTKLWGHHLSVPEEIAIEFIEGDNRRVICWLSDSVKIQSALMPAKDYWFILLNKNVRDQLGLEEGQKIEVKIEKDHSEFGLPMPESFRVLLDQDDEGRKHFESLTMGKQRNLVYIVGKVKNVDSQLNKGLAIMDHLKEVKGQLDFKKLNEKIKAYNNRNKF